MIGARLSGMALAVLLLGLQMAIGSADDTANNRPKPRGMDKNAVADSGVYGFSGARTGDNDPQGVVGECIWIFDAANKAQVARGICDETRPGQFRVGLKPGKYVVRGPGGNRAIQVKSGKWIKVDSIVPLPISF
jgi:hypothetical protein